MRNLYLYLALNSVCLIGLVGNFLGLNYYPQLNITAQSNFRISNRERELLAKVISQGFQINEAELDPQDADQEIYLYRVLYKNSPDSQWQNLCKSDGDNLTKAMLLWGEGECIDFELVKSHAITLKLHKKRSRNPPSQKYIPSGDL